jgi:hypothetical protein
MAVALKADMIEFLFKIISSPTAASQASQVVAPPAEEKKEQEKKEEKPEAPPGPSERLQSAALHTLSTIASKSSTLLFSFLHQQLSLSILSHFYFFLFFSTDESQRKLMDLKALPVLFGLAESKSLVLQEGAALVLSSCIANGFNFLFFVLPFPHILFLSFFSFLCVV